MTIITRFRLLALVLATGPLAALAGEPVSSPPLKQAAQGLFRVGVALNSAQITGADTASLQLVRTHFDSVTAENAMKWEWIHPAADRYEFALADQFVALGQSQNAQIIGHTLLWHSQAPDWIFKNADGSEVSRDELLRRLRDHIHTVVGRYRGKVNGWDVVNESLRDEDGLLRTDQPWYRILGEEAIFAAFEAAHQADPDAELYYNDYGLENPTKRAAVIKLLQKIRARGLRIDGVGNQGHYGYNWPKLGQLDQSLTDFARAGFTVMFTELDVSFLPRPKHYTGADISTAFASNPAYDPYPRGLPPKKQAELTRRYAEIFKIFAKHHHTVTRVTLWGVTDQMSWLNNWPIRGRTDYPLLFDRAGQPKPAYHEVVRILQATPRN